MFLEIVKVNMNEFIREDNVSFYKKFEIHHIVKLFVSFALVYEFINKVSFRSLKNVI